MTYESSVRTGALMPHLEREVEMSRLQTEISLLEQQIADMEAIEQRSQFKCSATQTDGDDTAWAHDAPKESKNLTFNFKTETPEGVSSGDPFVSIRQVEQQPMTSTPKPETDTKNSPSSNQVLQTTMPDIKGDTFPKALGTKIKPATFDGSGNWLDYKAHFEVCAQLNDWSDQEKGLYLAVSLRGQAQGVFGNI